MTSDPEFDQWLQEQADKGREEVAKSLPPEKVEELLDEVKRRGGASGRK